MADEFVEKALLKVRVLGLKIRNRIISTEGKSLKVNLADVALSSGVGIMTFPLCLGALQTGVFRPLQMTSNIRVIGSFCGGISVLIAGSAASLVFLSSSVVVKQVKDNPVKVFVEKILSFVPVERCSIDISVCSKDIPLYGFASLFVFKLLGGKFRSVLPSNLIYPGAFAKSYIPAKGQNYASNAVKEKLTLLGEFFYNFIRQHVVMIIQGPVVRKPVNANLGLKVSRSINFSCGQTFFTEYFCFVYYKIVQTRNSRANNIQKISLQSYKLK